MSLGNPQVGKFLINSGVRFEVLGLGIVELRGVLNANFSLIFDYVS